MRVVLDTDIILCALIAPAGKPAAIIDAWLDGRSTLLTCAAHVDELRATLQKPRVAELFKPHKAGRLANQVKKLAENIDPLPRLARSPDPTDDFLLILCEAGNADYLVTGDKRGLLALGRHKSHADSVCARFRRVAAMTPPEIKTNDSGEKTLPAVVRSLCAWGARRQMHSVLHFGQVWEPTRRADIRPGKCPARIGIRQGIVG
jgi:uncharacterized protein